MSMFNSIVCTEHSEILLNYSMGVNVNRCHCLINLIFSLVHAQIDTTTAYTTAAAPTTATTTVHLLKLPATMSIPLHR